MNKNPYKIISINLGRPKTINWKGEIVATAILRNLVMGSVKDGCKGLERDQQADLWVHGGKKKPFMRTLFIIHFGRKSRKKILSSMRTDLKGLASIVKI
ncbi:MAG: hypothetical protein O6939_02260 [Bacteroidetes bacterium]|nr:hypothetical protein [Bacteroidota bacterium]